LVELRPVPGENALVGGDHRPAALERRGDQGARRLLPTHQLDHQIHVVRPGDCRRIRREPVRGKGPRARQVPDGRPLQEQRRARGGALWVAWPRKSSGFFTDLDEQLVRAVGLAAGLTDNKVIAVDEIWSALRFVEKQRDRLPLPRTAEMSAPDA